MKRVCAVASFIRFMFIFAVVMAFATGCAIKTGSNGETGQIPVNPGSVEDEHVYIDFVPNAVPLTVFNIDFYVPSPVASGTLVESNEKALIDYSNMAEGYIMIKYLTAVDVDLKVQMKTPTGIVLPFNLRKDTEYDVFPLTDGNGTYVIDVCYYVPDSGKHALALNLTINVELADEFGPFLRPSTYLYYTATSPWIVKANELVDGKTDMLEVVTTVFNYVVDYVTYDYDWAARVKANDPTLDPFAPVDLGAVYASGTGVCSGYAGLMTSMLRSQNIPTRYVVGNTAKGERHAWINTYSDETGWVNGIIFFDGKGWKLMDPTYASEGGEAGMKYSENPAYYAVYYYY